MKKLFYLISILIMLGCGAVLVCALNPSLTQALVKTFYGEEHSQDVEILPPETVSREPVKQEEEVTTPTRIDAVMYPYYEMLSDEQRLVYKEIYDNAIAGNCVFTPQTAIHYTKLKDTFEAVCNDHPELFWMDTSYTCKYTEMGQCIEVSLQFNETFDSWEASKKTFEGQAQLILEEARKLSTVEEKEKYVHDVLVDRVNYNTNANMNQSAYAALINGESVCAGYARAFQYLMQQMDIPCYYCSGDSNGDHAWNIIHVGNGYYNVDVTWDDTNPSTYNYFNKTDAEYETTHIRKGLSKKLPACNGATTEVVESTSTYPYVNPNPQTPVEAPTSFFDSSVTDIQSERKENLEKAGVTESEVMHDMKEYYADCLKQTVALGKGQQSFSNVVSKSLWSSIEQAYSADNHMEGYANEALKKLKLENFAIQLQVERLGGGYYRIHHNISTW